MSTVEKKRRCSTGNVQTYPFDRDTAATAHDAGHGFRGDFQFPLLLVKNTDVVVGQADRRFEFGRKRLFGGIPFGGLYFQHFRGAAVKTFSQAPHGHISFAADFCKQGCNGVSAGGNLLVAGAQHGLFEFGGAWIY